MPDDLELTTRPTTPIDLPGSAPDPGMVWVGGGTFYLLGIADGNNEISEPLETNNLKYLTVVIP